jgi:hypothetical protein
MPEAVTGIVQRFFGRQGVEAEVGHPQHCSPPGGEGRIQMRRALQMQPRVPTTAAAALQDLQIVLDCAGCGFQGESPAFERRVRSADDVPRSARYALQILGIHARPDRFEAIA